MKSALVFAILLYCISIPAQAARVINSVLLNGNTTTNVAAGETVTVTMEVTTSGNGANANWKSTSYKFNDEPVICENTNDKNGRGTYTNTFEITAPLNGGSYNVSFYAHKNGSCNPGDPGSELVVPDGIVVSSLIAEYRFDEIEYTDTPNEIIDSAGGFHGQAKGSQPVEGKVCNAIDLSATGTSDYAVLDKDILTGKTDFSISVWAKTSKTSNQSVLSGAGSFSSNELIMWFENHTSFRPYLYNSQNGIITTSSIADNNWQHFVWTKEGSQSCLFVDKTLKGCVTQETFQLDIQSLILGQEQDAVGGDFSSSRAFDGLLDEFLVFDSAITPDEIATIYDNQNAGLGYDGSIRNCPILPSPVLDLHFDENNWDAANSIIDISGNDYHANAVNVTPTEGFICNAADLSATGINDYLSLDHSAINGLKDFTLSAWVNTARTSAQTILSVANSTQFNEAVFYYENNTSSWPTIRESPFNTSTKNPVSNISTGSWKHHVWTRKTNVNNGELCLYIDNVLQGCSTHNNGEFAIDVDATGFILGQEQDSLGGDFDSSQAFSGLLDEVLLFDKQLSVNDINNIYNNQVQGKNWDGTERSCGPLEPIAEWRMDEQAWNGSTGEVIDETGSFNGQSKNGADTARSTPALIGNPGTCAYGTFDGVNDYVALPTSFENQQGSFTITAWINPSNLQSGSRIFADDENNSRGYAFSLGDPGSGQLRFYSRGVSPVSVDTLSAVISADTWTFVTAVHNFDTKTREIYINGIAQTVTGGGTSNNYSGNWGVDTGIASIGGETDSGETGNRFTGSIDEVRMYDSALSAAEIEGVYRETHPCDSFIDHFEINTLNGQGLTCEPDIIKLRVCSDPSCSILTPDAVDVVLSVSDSMSDVLTKNVTIVGGEIDVEYIHTKAEVVSLSLDQTFECLNGSPTLCDVTFADAGFRFVTDSGDLTLPVQLSGKPSNIGFNADTFKIEAVKTDDATGACAPLLITGESIEMAASYQSPGTGTELVNISGKNIGTSITGTVFDSLPFIAVPLDFGGITQHSAEYIFTYPDAGSVVLNARYELPDDEGNPSGDFIKGTSNPIIVRPFAFDMFVDKNLPTGDTAYKVNPAATDGSGGEEDVFTVAADEIRISTRAVAWKTGDDANANGLADQVEDLTTNATTNNFIDVSLSSLSHTQLLPTSDIDGALSVETGAEFTSGSQVDIATYDEVGIISLQALKEDYLAAGVSIEGNTPYVGRFIPSHFTVTSIADGILTGTCSVDDSAELPFVYSGQMLSDSPTRGALSYLTTPSFVIEARNKDDVLTQNYIDDFLKLSLTSFQRLMVPNFAVPSVSMLAPVTDTSRMGKDTTNLVHLTANLDDANFTGVKGVISYSYHDEDNFVYSHEENSEVNEFTSDIDLSMVSIIDSDTVAAQDYDLDSSNGLILTLKPSGKLIRFGRAQLANSYGPDTSNLPQTLSVNYYTDDGYFLSENDTCTTYDYNNIFLSNISLDPALSPVQIIVPGKFSDELPLGETRDIILEAPTDNIKGVNTGQVGVIYNISDWLQYDWAYDTEGVDGLFNDNPRGIATFGIYRGNDRIIYQREISR
ncbi:LamG domain-containing protein [Colwellia psychrerythraea]|uniref:Uncharacterized protein n=1 Tax=Colwellia psychrerythraea (strain 34H / ATCC BAA-681) TaxID=167879 RepID=Q47VG2_COLP3|nr:LamG domain-containing protein [Colwellia psychrerythraea]AAZ26356.1 hypothetical protein CPS_4562 [Colwellia psychrerythraea 34H]